MKLATYRDGSRDGQLVVVSRDLVSAHYATGIATRLQQVLDDWNFIAPQLQDLSATLDSGKARHAFEFDPHLCMAPLPRAPQWVSGAAYLSRTELEWRAAGAEMPENLRTDPCVMQGSGDDLQGPCDPARCADPAWGLDFAAQIAVVTGDVDMGVAPEQALEGVRLILLANDWTLRALVPGELAKGFGLVQSKPATAFSPVAATPDELGAAWDGGRVHLTLQTVLNGKTVGACEAGPEMSFHFGQLIAHVARTRRLRGGSIVGSGAAGNRDWSRGCSSIVDRRAIETIEHGQPRTAYLQYGDTVRIDLKGRDGLSVCGAIEQQVAPL